MLAVLGDTYQVIERIGQGGTGVVYLAYHTRLRKYVVLKRSTLHAADLDFLRTEVDTLKELHHPTLPQVYDFLHIENDIFTVIDYIDGEDCEQIISSGQRFSEETLATYLMDLTTALVYLHQQDPPIFHSDIKPGNVMIRRDGSVVLIDFNIAVAQGMGLKGLSSYYASPEQRQLAWQVSGGHPITSGVDERSDIYSLGATFYYLMTGTAPGENSSRVIPLSSFDTGYSRSLIRILEKAMDPAPERRFQSALQLQQQVEKYFKRGKHFRQKCIAQAVVIFVSGMLICSGIWSVAYGLQGKRNDNFFTAYSQVHQELQQGEYTLAISDGIVILNEYPEQQEKSPKKWFYLLRFVGESYVARADQTDNLQEKQQYLQQAKLYYYDAAKIAMEEDFDDKETIVASCADLLLQLEDTRLLECLIEFATEAEVRTVQILSAQLEATKGNKELAMNTLELFIAAERESEYRAKAYQAMAVIVGEDISESIRLLKAAAKEHATTEIYRSLAKTYMELAEQSDAETAQICYQIAAEYYGLIFETGAFSDMMGCLVANRAAENYVVAEEYLMKIQQHLPDRFEVLAQGALLKRQMGLKLEAKEYAVAAIEAASSAEKDQHGTLWEAMQQILNEV